MLSKDFSPYSIVHWFYRRFRIKRIWAKVLTLFKIRRIKAGGSKHPSDRRIDSHSVKNTRACEQRSIDGGKKKEPKRHRVVDTQGIVHGTVHDANHSRGVQWFLRGSATLSDSQKRFRRCRVWKNHASVCKKRS
ncbi:hypothetical protein [Holospora curviuscula]|uniref:Transposase IS4-like domain-containing protein n=1 Tax=Holospora curviuscula TaxID=1082868 RepID=A0A2S5R6M4_9PROT|nr:hypothetical protein [Holospora curviuscula]PPE02978.1 hypothetical protein HCUR_01586 [Holospora curviuscula]